MLLLSIDFVVVIVLFHRRFRTMTFNAAVFLFLSMYQVPTNKLILCMFNSIHFAALVYSNGVSWRKIIILISPIERTLSKFADEHKNPSHLMVIAEFLALNVLWLNILISMFSDSKFDFSLTLDRDNQYDIFLHAISSQVNSLTFQLMNLVDHFVHTYFISKVIRPFYLRPIHELIISHLNGFEINKYFAVCLFFLKSKYLYVDCFLSSIFFSLKLQSSL